MENCIIEKLTHIFRKLGKEKPIIAFVMKPSILAAYRQRCDPKLVTFPAVYMDTLQEEDCLGFSNRDALRQYLTRNEKPVV